MRAIGKTVRGVYRIRIGKPMQEFLLGKDEREAYIRRAKLEQLWEVVRNDDYGNFPFPPTGEWTPTALDVGKAIANGKPVEIRMVGATDVQIVQQIEQLTAKFPMVTFVCPDLNEGNAKAYGQQLQERGAFIANGFRSGLTFHAALDQFKLHLRLDKEVGTDKVTRRARRLCVEVDIMKDHVADFDMSELKMAKVNEILAYWKNRPKSKKKAGNPHLAVNTVLDQIKLFRRFLRWAAENDIWKQPNGYSVQPIRLKLTDAERAASGIEQQVKTFKIREVVALYKACRNPFERVCVLLAMNCGFGRGELESLMRSEISKKFIGRLRRKTRVPGKWWLWPETRRAIADYLAVRPQSTAPHLLLTRDGKPLDQPSANGSPNGTIGNMFMKLVNRIRKTDEAFPKLSFNKLRKTSGNLVKRASDGETMAVFHSRGKTVATDSQSEVYSNRHYCKVYRACKRVRRKLQSAGMFT